MDRDQEVSALPRDSRHGLTPRPHPTVWKFCFCVWGIVVVFCHWNGFLLKYMSLVDFFLTGKCSLAFLSHDVLRKALALEELCSHPPEL